MATLRRIILNVRDMERATSFWVNGLGLHVKTTSPEWSLLQSTYFLQHVEKLGVHRRISLSICINFLKSFLYSFHNPILLFLHVLTL